jgi:hypothetical protein
VIVWRPNGDRGFFLGRSCFSVTTSRICNSIVHPKHPAGTRCTEQHVCEAFLRGLAGWGLEAVLAAMCVPFSEPAELRLFSDGEMLPLIPDSFLGGSAPRLEPFSLSSIPFPASPNLLFSATHLVYLGLTNISPAIGLAPVRPARSIQATPVLTVR